MTGRTGLKTGRTAFLFYFRGELPGKQGVLHLGIKKTGRTAFFPFFFQTIEVTRRFLYLIENRSSKQTDKVCAAAPALSDALSTYKYLNSLIQAHRNLPYKVSKPTSLVSSQYCSHTLLHLWLTFSESGLILCVLGGLKSRVVSLVAWAERSS